MQRAGDHGTLERRLAEYETLLEIGVELASTLDLAARARRSRCARPRSSATPSRARSGSSTRSAASCSSASCAAAPRARSASCACRSAQGIVGSVARTGQAEIVNDVAADPRWRGDPRRQLRHPRHPHRAAGRARPGHRRAAAAQPASAATASPPTTCAACSCSPARSPHALDNARLYAAQKRQFVEIVTALAEAIEKRDPYTGGHVRRVVAYSVLLGQELGLAARGARASCGWRRPCTTSARSRCPTRSSTSRRRSSREETRGHASATPSTAPRSWRRIREPARRAAGRPQPPRAARRQGLPRRPHRRRDLRVPRIIAVADTYDAMTTGRPYRARSPPRSRRRRSRAAPARSSARAWPPRSAALRARRVHARGGTSGCWLPCPRSPTWGWCYKKSY